MLIDQAARGIGWSKFAENSRKALMSKVGALHISLFLCVQFFGMFRRGFLTFPFELRFFTLRHRLVSQCVYHPSFSLLTLLAVSDFVSLLDLMHNYYSDYTKSA